ncbi:MAG: CAP domain-containing protein, partial [Anaerolineaceae bacterium]
ISRQRFSSPKTAGCGVKCSIPYPHPLSDPVYKPFSQFANQRLKSVCFLLILLGCLIPAHKGTAQTSAYAIIEQVNLLRASYGLAPYSVDSGLMSVAQGHASYMASIQTATHYRADGSSPWQLGY